MAPEFVIDLQLKGHITEEGQGYDQNLTDFFQESATTEVFKVRVGEDPDEPGQELLESLMESSRIYMENTMRPDKTKGRPFNYLKTEKEVITEIVAEKDRKEEEKRKIAEKRMITEIVAEKDRKE